MTAMNRGREIISTWDDLLFHMACVPFVYVESDGIAWDHGHSQACIRIADRVVHGEILKGGNYGLLPMCGVIFLCLTSLWVQRYFGSLGAY
jgi:hypothetical protein